MGSHSGTGTGTGSGYSGSTGTGTTGTHSVGGAHTMGGTTTNTANTGAGAHTTGADIGDHVVQHEKAAHMGGPTNTETTQAGATTTTTTTTEAADDTRGPVCNTKYATAIEDRPVEKEIVERVVEHHPVEKKFAVETRLVGEEEVAGGRRIDSRGITENIVNVKEPAKPCYGHPEVDINPRKGDAHVLGNTGTGVGHTGTGVGPTGTGTGRI